VKPPPDMQTSAILLFLKEALRTDPYIQTWSEASPEEIVALTAEYQPIQRADGETYIYLSRLPALCLHTVSATPQRRGKRWGLKRNMWLWYVFKTMGASSADLHPLGKTERWKTLIAWRMGYWLRKQVFYTHGSDDPTMDLQELSNIRIMDIQNIEWFSEGDLEGIKMSLSVDHLWAPYEEVDPATFDLLDFSIHTFDPATPLVAELEVEADIDQT